jgi:hypothetical protein
VSLFARYSPRARRVIFYSVHYARKAGSRYIEPEHILEGLLLEDPKLFDLVFPEKANLVKELNDELATWRGSPTPQTEKKDLSLSPAAKEVVAAAGTEQLRLGHSNIATQHLLLALLTACRQRPRWFRKATKLRVQQLLTKHGITPELTERKTSSRIVTPSTCVLDDRLVALNAQIAALAELLVNRNIFTRAEFVASLDRNEGPLVPEAFLLPLIEALAKERHPPRGGAEEDRSCACKRRSFGRQGSPEGTPEPAVAVVGTLTIGVKTAYQTLKRYPPKAAAMQIVIGLLSGSVLSSSAKADFLWVQTKAAAVNAAFRRRSPQRTRCSSAGVRESLTAPVFVAHSNRKICLKKRLPFSLISTTVLSDVATEQDHRMGGPPEWVALQLFSASAASATRLPWPRGRSQTW